jgi:hypothetical protein
MTPQSNPPDQAIVRRKRLRPKCPNEGKRPRDKISSAFIVANIAIVEIEHTAVATSKVKAGRNEAASGVNA